MDASFTSHADECKKKVREAVERGLRKVGATIAGYAADLAPYHTGLLRNSITFAISGEATEKTEYKADYGTGKGFYRGTADQEPDNQKAVLIGTNVQYAPYQELGAPNAHVPPSPFLRPAVENHRAEINKIMEEELKKA